MTYSSAVNATNEIANHSSAMSAIKYLDLKKINNRFRPEILGQLEDMLDTGQYIGGSLNQKFCRDFAARCGTSNAVGVGNGLDALRIIIEAAGLGQGDEIIVPANTFIATILAIYQAGCTPVLVEPDENTFNLDPDCIEAAITPRTRAVMAVHLYGRMAPMDKIGTISKNHGLLIFEDAAQAHGAALSGRPAGSMSDAAAFSFYPGKNLGCLGDGGAIVSNNEELIQKAAMIANYGSQRKYEHECRGCNSRLDDFQAGVLSIKLPLLDSDNHRRRQIAQFFNERINNPALRLPDHPDNPLEHVWHIYAVRVADREGFRRHMQSMGIETLVHYPVPPHRQTALAKLAHLSLPVTERIHREVVSLPLNPVLADTEIERIVEAANAWK